MAASEQLGTTDDRLRERVEQELRSSQLTQVTRSVVAIYKDQLGRGPTHAQSHFAGRDSIVCYLEETLTPVERTLVRIGEFQRLQDLRQLFQRAAEEAFRAAVEEITGRTVVSFMSGNDVRNDVASEIFLFERSAPSR